MRHRRWIAENVVAANALRILVSALREHVSAASVRTATADEIPGKEGSLPGNDVYLNIIFLERGSGGSDGSKTDLNRN